MEEVIEGKDYSFPAEEKTILNHWDATDAFKEQLRRTEGMPEYIFYDGPPFATGLPHYGHILAGTLKDIVTRYAVATGHHVSRRFGWDCHGLPVEYEIDKKLGIKTRDDVLKMGIDKYNEECRSIVMRYSKEWESTVHRLGRWIDFKNDYKTLDLPFMESVWWVFRQLFDKGLVYRGFKVMPFSTGCSTSLSNFEANLNYKDVDDPAVMVSFPIVGDADGAAFVAWTTTPWTLPSNLALCVNADFTYVRVRDPAKDRVYVVAESRLAFMPGAVPKASKKKGKDGGDEKPKEGWQVLAKVKGSELVGLTYEPLFPYFVSRFAGRAFRVLSDGYVTDDSGTGVVHQAPAFGEDDNRVCLAHGVIERGADDVPCPVDLSGRFTDEVPDFAGMAVKEADKSIIASVKESGRLVDSASLNHSYPFCWRSDTPLIYRAVPSWFVSVETIKEKLIENNRQTYWVPSYVKEKRFHNWLESARDWAVSRSRFWGTPLPIWVSEDGEEVVCIGSIAELEEATDAKVTDLHRHFIDHLTIPSRKGKGMLRRVEEVFDCWFESGSMPYAQQHYPFENKDVFENGFPADFVAEGLDQTRGWFYTLMVLSTALFDKPAFKNLVCNGLVLAADGKKMSKRLKNYPDPNEVVNKYGADALRLYLINSPVVRAEPLRFKEEGVFGVVKDVFLPWYNAYRFLVQNVIRWEMDTGRKFEPSKVDLSGATNVLDRWIGAASRSLTIYVKAEMDAYRLYTVVPYLVQFLESLTNVYVRYNRKRMKGSGGPDDSLNALASLFDVLLSVCKVMAPFTPFLTEKMYLNLRRCLPEDDAAAPPSVHFCAFPAAAAAREGDERIQKSVDRMQRVVELARTIRERKNKPLKFPLKTLVVVHTDAEFLDDMNGELAEYVCSELNVRSLETCADPTKYATLRAEPDWQALGRRLGKQMGAVAAAVKAMGASDIAAYEAAGGNAVVGGVELGPGDVKVLRDFRVPDGVSPDDIDANGDGEVLAVLNLQVDKELAAAGVAREVVNRFQKLRKKAGLVVTDVVEAYYGVPDGSSLPEMLAPHAEYLRASLGRPLLPLSALPRGAVVVARSASAVGTEEDGTAASFEAVVAVPAVATVADRLLAACGGSADLAEAVDVYLASRDLRALQAQAEAAGGVVGLRVDGADVRLTVGKELFFSAAAAFAAA
uniref:isoleucine--tRNA ligase n=1 Tax=Chlamydomonas euryale TaxID=1486919 RepID=A0A7R9VFZ8_9CHLO|mmetsp:Transcript_34356/g.102078  ORF Transcript_34356/g.102078 Transcript_34356/m.102078 type:complete len:1174 (+) Transcript_34356:276-3797(+)